MALFGSLAAIFALASRRHKWPPGTGVPKPFGLCPDCLPPRATCYNIPNDIDPGHSNCHTAFAMDATQMPAAPPRHGPSVVAIVCLASLAIAVGCLFLKPIRAQTQSAPAPVEKTFDIASDPDFGKFNRVVTRFAAKHRPGKENNFCILGFSVEGTKSAWVVWREGGQILLWDGGDDLDRSRRVIHLKSDVVATEEDLHGSTYRVTKSWVDGLTRSCESPGVKVRAGGAAASRKRNGESK